MKVVVSEESCQAKERFLKGIFVTQRKQQGETSRPTAHEAIAHTSPHQCLKRSGLWHDECGIDELATVELIDARIGIRPTVRLHLCDAAAKFQSEDRQFYGIHAILVKGCAGHWYPRYCLFV